MVEPTPLSLSGKFEASASPRAGSQASPVRKATRLGVLSSLCVCVCVCVWMSVCECVCMSVCVSQVERENNVCCDRIE